MNDNLNNNRGMNMKTRVEVSTQAEFDVQARIGNTLIIVRAGFFIAWGNSSVEARENSSVEARGNSSVEAWENSSVVAWENSSVVARENSSVVARGNVFVRLFSAIKIKASANVVIMRHGKCKSISGGIKIEAVKIKTVKDWACFYGTTIVRGFITVYKAVNDKYTTSR